MFTITDPARPWVILFSAPTLAEIAEALRAQPEPDRLKVTFVQDGFARQLTPDEAGRLARG